MLMTDQCRDGGCSMIDGWIVWGPPGPGLAGLGRPGRLKETQQHPSINSIELPSCVDPILIGNRRFSFIGKSTWTHPLV